ncbi:MAG TPA: hypothetical protein VFY36_03645 [Solirubrobacteraceae bacterium]|nr:hypothetical protein [Solirubrobacteraceae bacterium]
MLGAFIERWLDREAQRRQAEVVLAANLAIREIKRRAIRQLLDADRQAPSRRPAHGDVIEGSVVERRL